MAAAVRGDPGQTRTARIPVVNHPTRSNLLRHERPGLLHFLEFVDRSRCPIGFTTVAPDFGQQKPGSPVAAQRLSRAGNQG